MNLKKISIKIKLQHLDSDIQMLFYFIYFNLVTTSNGNLEPEMELNLKIYCSRIKLNLARSGGPNDNDIDFYRKALNE